MMGDTPNNITRGGEPLGYDDFDAGFDRWFPAPSPRNKQRAAIEHACQALAQDGAFERSSVDGEKEVVLIDAPPGFGKSITLDTIVRVLGGKAFYASPLKSLQDQLVGDEFIGDRVEDIKGRNNYKCILPDAEPNTTVDVGKCQTDSDFECDIKDSCLYYKQKAKARGSQIAVMNFSYLMAESMVPDDAEGSFGKRDILIVDECQGIDQWAINFVGFKVNQRTIPTYAWERVDMPPKKELEDYDFAVEWLRDELQPACTAAVEELESVPSKSKKQQKAQERLVQFSKKLTTFLRDEDDHQWLSKANTDIRKNAPNITSLEFEPAYVGRFMEDLLWSRADKIILSSATVPRGDWLDEIGLGDKKVLRLNVPSPFPVENRPIIINEAVGKMNYDNREKNMPDMVDKIKLIADHHEGQKGIIHCRGYTYMKMFKKSCINRGMREWFNNNCAVQDRDAREESLESWIESDKQIFLSVNMAEGIDLKGDRCRWQVLLKALFPSLANERVKYRLQELGDQQWYTNKAVIQIEQAYGRAVRSPEDEAVFYILDESAVNTIKYNQELFHDWFLEAVQW